MVCHPHEGHFAHSTSCMPQPVQSQGFDTSGHTNPAELVCLFIQKYRCLQENERVSPMIPEQTLMKPGRSSCSSASTSSTGAHSNGVHVLRGTSCFCVAIYRVIVIQFFRYSLVAFSKLILCGHMKECCCRAYPHSNLP